LFSGILIKCSRRPEPKGRNSQQLNFTIAVDRSIVGAMLAGGFALAITSQPWLNN
jgi:hypothetical protein